VSDLQTGIRISSLSLAIALSARSPSLPEAAAHLHPGTYASHRSPLRRATRIGRTDDPCGARMDGWSLALPHSSGSWQIDDTWVGPAQIFPESATSAAQIFPESATSAAQIFPENTTCVGRDHSPFPMCKRSFETKRDIEIS
jgi:hypothetical protein